MKISSTISALAMGALIATLPGGSKADSNLFTGNSFYGLGNQYTQNGCCGYFRMSLSGNGMGPSGNSIIANYFRTVVIYITPDAPGTFRLNVALADWLGGFNPQVDYANPRFGNRLIAQTDPIPWKGLYNDLILSAYWDTQWRWVSFSINDVQVNTNIVYNTGPNASFQVNYANSPVWTIGSDSSEMLIYGWNPRGSLLGCCGQPQASDYLQFHLWDWGYNGNGWDYGPGIQTFNSRGAPGTVTNAYPLNWYGWSGAFEFGDQHVDYRDNGYNCCVTFEDLTLSSP